MVSGEKESEIQKAILEFLRYKGILAWRTNSGLSWQVYKGKQYPVHNAPKGTSDIIGCYQGKFLAIEVKKSDGVVSEHQQNFIDSIKNLGGIAFVARSIDDVQKELNAIAKCG